MKFTDEYLENNYPEFFAYINMRSSETHMSLIANRAWKNKAAIRDVFPFDHTGRLLIATYSDSTEAALKSFEKTIASLTTILEYALECTVRAKYIPRMLLKNCVETGPFSGRKISKILSGYAVSARHIDMLIDADLCTELPRLPLHAKGKLDIVTQNFYSELAQLNKTKSTLYFSVNPVDMLRASVGKVLSCNKLGGLAESFPLSAATSTSMGILRLVSDKGELLGRCWVGVAPTFKAFTVQPCYGMMGTAHVTDFFEWVRRWIDERIPCGRIPEMWFCSDASLTIPTDVFSETAIVNDYVDNSHAFMYRGNISKAKPVLTPGFCCCTICGVPSPNLFCDACEEKYFSTCEKCGIKVAKSLGTTLCPACENLRAVCSFCQTSFIKPNTKNADVCNSCANTSAQCFFCGGTLYSVPAINTDGEEPPRYYDYNRIVTLVQGSIYAHSDCMREHHISTCPGCGCNLGNWRLSNFCMSCATIDIVESTIAASVKKIKAFYADIRSCSKAV